MFTQSKFSKDIFENTRLLMGVAKGIYRVKMVVLSTKSVSTFVDRGHSHVAELLLTTIPNHL